MKVLGLAGSPRRGGNTDILLAEVLNGAAASGAETETVILDKLALSPCKHCDYCLKAGRCSINDDMQYIYPKLSSADVIVLASPIQFMGITAPVKAMIDRCQCLWSRKYVLKIPPLEPVKERRGFFISVAGRKTLDMFGPSLAIVKTFFRVLNVTYSGELLFPGIDEKGSIKNHPDALKQAFAAGTRLTN